MTTGNLIHRFAALTAHAEGLIRTATVAGREYMIVPAVLVVGDIVWQPMGSEGPEYVPSAVLAANPEQWNSVPLLCDHPAALAPASGNPAIVAAQGIGHVAAARFHDNRLKAEAWIDIARAETLSNASRAILAALRAGESVEVSIGAIVAAVREYGNFGGKPYNARWTSIAADHLAALSSGPGACSIERGCGMPRAAQTVTLANVHVSHVTVAAPAVGVTTMTNVTLPASELAALRRIAAEVEQRDNAIRANLIPQLLANPRLAGAGFTRADFEAKSAEELMKLARMIEETGAGHFDTRPEWDPWNISKPRAAAAEPACPYGLDKKK